MTSCGAGFNSRDYAAACRFAPSYHSLLQRTAILTPAGGLQVVELQDPSTAKQSMEGMLGMSLWHFNVVQL